MLSSLLRPRFLGPSTLRAAQNLRTAAALRDEQPSTNHNDVEATDQQAAEYYKSHASSHFNLPLDQIEFRVGEHYVTKEPHPHVHFVGPTQVQQPYNGIMNVTPFSKTLYPWFGLAGNIGKKSKFTKNKDGIISDPADAKQEIPIVAEPTNINAGENDQLWSYMEWIKGLNEKYMQHLTEHLEEYPMLDKKFGFLLKSDGEDRSTVRQMVESMMTKPIKYRRDENGAVIDNSDYLLFDQKIYFNQTGKFYTRCELDEEMQAQGMGRKHIPLYDRTGNEIPLEQVKLQSGDIISVQSNITCALYEVGGNVGAGLRKNVKSVTLLRTRENASSGEVPEAPFQF